MATSLPIDKTVLASSPKTAVQLLDCGEGYQGRYEVVVLNVLVACTDDYAGARGYYFKEASRIRSEQQAVYNARYSEAQAAGVDGWRAQQYAAGSMTLEAAIESQHTPCGIPAEELPINLQSAPCSVTFAARMQKETVFHTRLDGEPLELVDYYSVTITVADHLLDEYVVKLHETARSMFTSCAEYDAEGDGNSWAYFTCKTEADLDELRAEHRRLNTLQKWAFPYAPAKREQQL